MEIRCCTTKRCQCGLRVRIELIKEELVYDIKNTAYTYADSIVVQDPHQKHNIFDVGEDGNRDKIARLMDVAVEDCRELLFAFTKQNVLGGEFSTNDWDECEGSPESDLDAYYLGLTVPPSWSHTSANTLAVYAHDYIVNKVMYDWLMIVYPDGATQFATLASEVAEKIKQAANRDVGRKRIRLHPF